MNGWLLDTNVISEGRKPNPNTRVATFVATLPIEHMFVSMVTVVEIRFGIEVASGSNRIDLDIWLTQNIRPMFADRVLPITEDIMLRWRLLVEAGRKAGRTFSQPDLILAATALEYDMTLITRNARDFAGTGVRMLNPWDYQP